MDNRRLVICLALDKKIQLNIVILIKILIFLSRNIFKCDYIIISTQNSKYLSRFNKYIIKDNNSLFDFSRYNDIIHCNFVKDTDILFALNDTLGSGRKLGIGLYLFILHSLWESFNRKNSRNLYCPVDSDEYDSWICPYFFIGKRKYLKKLNFINWKLCSNSIDKNLKIKLISWLNNHWRSREFSNYKQYRTKYKVLLLERCLVDISEMKKVGKYSKKSFFRVLNSII